jgi:hypothetical protein
VDVSYLGGHWIAVFRIERRRLGPVPGGAVRLLLWFDVLQISQIQF